MRLIVYLFISERLFPFLSGMPETKTLPNPLSGERAGQPGQKPTKIYRKKKIISERRKKYKISIDDAHKDML